MAAAASGAKSLLKSRFVALQKEISDLKEAEKMLREKETCCQLVKEMLLQGTKLHDNKTTKPIGNRTFLEMYELLSEIKKLKTKHLMLKYQLYLKNNEVKVETMNKILIQHSKMLQERQIIERNDQEEILSPLKYWYLKMLEINQQQNTQNEPIDENGFLKFSKRSELFYNISYKNGINDPSDVLADGILTKKIKRPVKDKRLLESLQFSTCYNGYCVNLRITRNNEKSIESHFDDQMLENGVKDSVIPTTLYECHSDTELDTVHEKLLDCLSQRKCPGEFVKLSVWTEIGKLFGVGQI